MRFKFELNLTKSYLSIGDFYGTNNIQLTAKILDEIKAKIKREKFVILWLYKELKTCIGKKIIH